VNWTQSSIHLFSIPALPNSGSQRGWGCSYSLSHPSLGERQATPWTGVQSIMESHRDKWDKQPYSLPPRVNLETPVNLTSMLLGGGREPEHSEKTHAYTRKHANSGIRTRNPLAVRWWSEIPPNVQSCTGCLKIQYKTYNKTYMRARR